MRNWYEFINLLAQASTRVIQNRENTESPGFLCRRGSQGAEGTRGRGSSQRGQGDKRVCSDVSGSVGSATRASKGGPEPAVTHKRGPKTRSGSKGPHRICNHSAIARDKSQLGSKLKSRAAMMVCRQDDLSGVRIPSGMCTQLPGTGTHALSPSSWEVGAGGFQ